LKYNHIYVTIHAVLNQFIYSHFIKPTFN